VAAGAHASLTRSPAVSMAQAGMYEWELGRGKLAAAAVLVYCMGSCWYAANAAVTVPPVLAAAAAAAAAAAVNRVEPSI
jgi:hypothetical protein